MLVGTHTRLQRGICVYCDEVERCVRISVAAAPANCRLEPEPEPAPIRAEPSRIWSSRHFSRLSGSRLGSAEPAKPPFFLFLSHPLCPSSPSSWSSCPSHAQPILSFLNNFLSSQVTEAFHRTFR